MRKKKGHKKVKKDKKAKSAAAQEFDEDKEYRGILPNRDLKKNLGCG